MYAERLATKYRCSVTEAQAMIDTMTVPASDHSALRALALQVGLPEVEVDAVLTSERYSDAVRADEAQARAYGISGVPFFVIDGRYGISGAQPADAVLQTLDKAWSERSPLTLVAPESSAPSCEGDSCAV